MSATELLDALELIQPFLFGVLTVVALRLWMRHPAPASAWLAGGFLVLGLVVIAGQLLPEEPAGSLELWASKALIALLVLFPYCLYRFMRTFVRPVGWVKTAATAVTTALVLGALALPSFPEGDARPAWFEAYIAVLLVQWVSLSALVAVRLWRAGRGQPVVARRRMRTMSIGAVGLALALVIAGESPGGTTTELVVQILVLTTSPLMLVGFAGPRILRMWWRREDDDALQNAERSLMKATTEAEITQVLLPNVRALVGAPAAQLEGADGEIIASNGGGSDEDATVLSFPMSSGRLTVIASPFMPFFGHDEIERLEGFAALADLALERAQLLGNQQKLARIVESSDDAITSETLDATITTWNRGAHRIYGYEASEVIGRPISILVPDEMKNDIPAIIGKVRAGQGLYHYDTKRRTKDGRTIDVSLTVSPVLDTSGAVVGASTIARDISESTRLHAELAEQARMLDLVEDAVIARDMTGKITYWNRTAESIFGYTKEEATGKLSHALLKTSFPESVTAIEAEVSKRERWEGELVHTAKDGSQIIAASRWTLRRDADGRPIQVLEVNNDITATKKADEEHLKQQQSLSASLKAARDAAQEANLAKSEFLSRMSHELRTPLNAILGFAQLLEMDELVPDQRESTEQIIKGGRRLLELINEVLDIARIESGRLMLSMEPVLVCDVIEECVGLLRPVGTERGIRIEFERPADLSNQHVRADRGRLGQVLLNLLSNAVKYNATDGTVTVSCLQATPESVRIGVTDTGPGIPPDKVHLLFTPFERLGAEATDEEGTGLGLALTKSLVEAMDGRILADSMMGKGTTFWVELRAAEEPAEATREETDPPEHRPFPRGARVLYIEDNLSNLRLIERLLQRRGEVDLISAMTGELGIDLARQHRPNLILLDLDLPDIRGDEVLARLRKDPLTQHIPIVILSADATSGEINRLLTNGAMEYLTKPVDVTAFLRVMNEIFAAIPEGQ